jgi:hypothetical protein
MMRTLENKTSGMPMLQRRSSSSPIRPRHAGGWWRLAVFVLVAITRTDLNATEPRSKLGHEYDLEAAFLVNFAQFVQWPPDTFAQTDTPIVVGILGDDPFGPILDKIAAGETIQNRKLVIKRSRQVKDLKNCQMLFIGKSERARLRKIFVSLGKASVLTVGETDGFTQQGGVTHFYVQGNRLRFEVNLEAARRKGLKISAQLLDLGPETVSVPVRGGS